MCADLGALVGQPSRRVAPFFLPRKQLLILNSSCIRARVLFIYGQRDLSFQEKMKTPDRQFDSPNGDE